MRVLALLLTLAITLGLFIAVVGCGGEEITAEEKTAPPVLNPGAECGGAPDAGTPAGAGCEAPSGG